MAWMCGSLVVSASSTQSALARQRAELGITFGYSAYERALGDVVARADLRVVGQVVRVEAGRLAVGLPALGGDDALLALSSSSWGSNGKGVLFLTICKKWLYSEASPTSMPPDCRTGVRESMYLYFYQVLR